MGTLFADHEKKNTKLRNVLQKFSVAWYFLSVSDRTNTLLPCGLDLKFTGYYMYIEASSPRKKGDNAMLGTAVFKSKSTCQLRFFYHMYGTHIGTLNVYTRTSTSGPLNKIWTKTGNQGDKWVKATASISVSQNFQVRSAGGVSHSHYAKYQGFAM